ncbi:TfoX/Sxy family protein [Devosia sp.]|uniref:TfoX/Sxy family protein n=1 Tax=Devosia sp. TaxID=1871048 RepID=UPI003265731A
MSDQLIELSNRIRDLLDGDPRITEKKMFGGLSFLLNGHLFISAKKDGRAMIAVGKDNYEAALERPGARPMTHGKGAMTGFIWLDADEAESKDTLREWIVLAEHHVKTLKPKTK